MVSSIVERPPNAFICPISLELMTNPHRLVGSQQCYQKESLLEWLNSGGQIDPITGLPLQTTQIEFDAELHNQIQQWNLRGDVAPPQAPAPATSPTAEPALTNTAGGKGVPVVLKAGSLSSKVSARVLSTRALLDRMLPQLTAGS